jgi:hypothetical protein
LTLKFQIFLARFERLQNLDYVVSAARPRQRSRAGKA